MFSIDPEHDDLQENHVLKFVVFIVPCSRPTSGGTIACSPLTCSIYHHDLWAYTPLFWIAPKNSFVSCRHLGNWYVCMFKGTRKTFVKTSNPWASLEHFFCRGLTKCKPQSFSKKIMDTQQEIRGIGYSCYQGTISYLYLLKKALLCRGGIGGCFLIPVKKS